MSFVEAFRVALEALATNKLRSLLTMLGMVIGVLAVILLIALGQGAKAYIVGELTGLGTNLLIIQPGKTETTGAFHPLSTVRKLTYEDALALKRRIPLLEEAIPVVLGSGKAKYVNRSRDVPVVGVTPEYQRVRRLFVETGAFFTAEDVEAKRRVVVLGRTVKRELFGEENPLGQMITLAGARYRVIGVMEPKGVTLGIDMDDLVFIPVRSAQELFDTDQLFEILASVASPEALDPAIEEIKGVLSRRHGREDFHIISQGDMLSTLQRILDILTAVLAGIAGVSLLVGGIGIMNIMLVSVTERTREIGLRKAVGARKRDILRQFLVEAVTLSLLGGAAGIGMGAGAAKLLPLFFPSLPTQVTLWSILLAFAASATVGILSGVYPARRASRLDPIVALRYE